MLIAATMVACAPKGDVRDAPDSAVDLKPTAFDNLSFWSRDRQGAALAAFRRSCPALVSGGPVRTGGRVISQNDWRPVCTAADQIAAMDVLAARKFFETWFVPHLVSHKGKTEGLFTGYFEAELRGSKTRSERYNVPLHGLPDDLVRVELGSFDSKLRGRAVVGRVANGRIVKYHRRGEIQRGALQGRAPVLAWLDDPVDAFLLHVQGSGRVLLEDGAVMRVGYAGNNGHGYVSIGRALIKQGELSPGRAGWTQIRGWMEENPEKSASLLAQNPRYIFFREISGEGPIGAHGVPLTPRRSMAVDRRYIPLGVPIWLDTVWPGSGERPLRRLMIAQDTGSAIKGPVRGDFFWGYGKDALAEAGRMKSQGRYYILLPKSIAVPVS